MCHTDGTSFAVHCLPDCQYDLRRPTDRARCYWSLNYSLWNKLFRREAIASLRFEQFEANICEDTLFNVAALYRSRTIVSTSYVGYEYTVHATSATGRQAKDISYLRTLAESGVKIRETLLTADASAVDRWYADLYALKSFALGCTWIAENPDPAEQARMWCHWRLYLREKLLPELQSCRLLGIWCRLLTAIGRPSLIYPLTRYAMRIGQPVWRWNLVRGPYGWERRPGRPFPLIKPQLTGTKPSPNSSQGKPKS
jgi:hypothetical protein